MEIALARYVRQTSHAQSGRLEQVGLLFKITWENSVVGYSDLALWPLYGDPSIEELSRHLRELTQNSELQALAQTFLHDEKYFLAQGRQDLLSEVRDLAHRLYELLPKVLPSILKATILSNLLDAWGRKYEVAWLDGANVPLSHKLITAGTQWDKQILEAMRQGFHAVKIKILLSTPDRVAMMNQLSDQFGSQIKLRFDFNSSLTREELVKIDEPLKIEFIEDPSPFEDHRWAKLHECVPLACDFEQAPSDAVDVIVIKPARENLFSKLQYFSQHKICITHAMDSNVGRSTAAFFASLLAADPKLIECGLLSETASAPRWTAPFTGFGFGQDEFLNSAAWSNI